MIFKSIYFAVIGLLSLFEVVYIVRFINGGVKLAGCPGGFLLFAVILVFMIGSIPELKNSERPDRYRYL